MSNTFPIILSFISRSPDLHFITILKSLLYAIEFMLRLLKSTFITSINPIFYIFFPWFKFSYNNYKSLYNMRNENICLFYLIELIQLSLF